MTTLGITTGTNLKNVLWYYHTVSCKITIKFACSFLRYSLVREENLAFPDTCTFVFLCCACVLNAIIEYCSQYKTPCIQNKAFTALQYSLYG